jgi:methylamine--corrinoid protein Co-methyltransferase
MAEVAHAAVRQRLTLAQANALVLQLIGRYEHVFSRSGGNPGMRFDQAYDLNTLQPVPAWLEMYQAVKNEVRQMGLAALE